MPSTRRRPHAIVVPSAEWQAVHGQLTMPRRGKIEDRQRGAAPNDHAAAGGSGHVHE